MTVPGPQGVGGSAQRAPTPTAPGPTHPGGRRGQVGWARGSPPSGCRGTTSHPHPRGVPRLQPPRGSGPPSFRPATTRGSPAAGDPAQGRGLGSAAERFSQAAAVRRWGRGLAPPTAPPSPGSTAPPETPRREQWEGEDGGGGGAQQTSSGSSHPSLCPSGDLALCGQGLGPWLRPAATPPPTCLTSGAPTSPEPPSLQPRAPGWPLGLPGVCDARQGRAKHRCGLLLPSRHGEVFQGPAVSLAGALPAVQGETGTR